MNRIIIIYSFVFATLFSLLAQDAHKISSLPKKGICAHRGASLTHPENTISAFVEAVKLGANMIEFDVRMTKDEHLVVIHDESVNRTTNGSGLVAEMILAEIQKLDAGSWKSSEFTNERIPTLKEAIESIPKDIWLNIHLKGDELLGESVARVIIENDKKDQALVACGRNAEMGVKNVDSSIMVCNMERQQNRFDYVNETIKGDYPFIQLLKKRKDESLEKDIAALKKKGVKINYYYANSVDDARTLFNMGVDFVLTDNLAELVKEFNFKNNK